jgi:hypothetical protein
MAKLTTKKFLSQIGDGCGVLNKLPSKSSERSPDYSGYVKIGGRTFKVSGWVGKDRNGSNNISIRATPCDDNGSFTISGTPTKSI